jgi:hypothetical protein
MPFKDNSIKLKLKEFQSCKAPRQSRTSLDISILLWEDYFLILTG